MQINNTFIKLMMMTTSENDGEALNALRKANKILATSNMSWEQLLMKSLAAPQQTARPPPRPEPNWDNVPQPQPAGPGRRRRYTDRKEINHLFSLALRNNLPENYLAKVMGIRQWWDDHQFLSERQYNAIKQAAET